MSWVRQRRGSGSAARCRRVFALVGAVLIGLAGCASIPSHTPPQPVAKDGPNTPTSVAAAEPDKGLDPLNLVRNFVQAAANPADDFAEAKPYLTKQARADWDTNSSVTILDNTFRTVYSTGPDEPADAGRTRTVLLQGKNVGRLDSDYAFVPQFGDVEVPITVERQADDQWRIVKPPAGVYLTLTGFSTGYKPVRLYFFDPERSVLVPDLRYVIGSPAPGVPGRVIDLLLDGPADGLHSALASALGPNTTTNTQVTESTDGALVVDLKQTGDLTPQTREQIVAQIVRSLENVTSSRVRVEVDREALFPEHPDWRASDLKSYEPSAAVDVEHHGLVVANGQVRSLKDGAQVNGPAGNGQYAVHSATQSPDGSLLAVVSGTERGPRLRVGKMDQSLAEVNLTATTDITRPSWRPVNSSNNPSNELWTVADGNNVVQVVNNASDGSWVAKPINASELTQYGLITDLRLSRDGTRVAAVVSGKLVVGAVQRNPDSSVTIRQAKKLQSDALSSVLSVDWLSQETVVVGTASSLIPVARVSVDGFQMERYNTSNLTVPVSSVTAASGHSVIAVDGRGLWTATEIGEVWRQNPVNPGPNSVVSYPG